MHGLKKVAVFCSIATLLLSSTACTTTPTANQNIHAQEDAMARWSACIARNTNQQALVVIDVSQLLEHYCEGYRRDVIAAFPPNLEKQVDQVLVSSVHRALDPDNNLTPIQANEANLVNTVLR